ncbi:uncharacterized protein LOC116923204 [Daphnia magna]|uniref:uncharacterized protein LOC116923204 n=1 Tax=Daphnia magna TaxID=35525 RepID=UPI001E1BB8C5|nr:uncharacterized protein LOC116923204 [Daphnia magna]
MRTREYVWIKQKQRRAIPDIVCTISQTRRKFPDGGSADKNENPNDNIGGGQSRCTNTIRLFISGDNTIIDGSLRLDHEMAAVTDSVAMGSRVVAELGLFTHTKRTELGKRRTAALDG